MVDGLPTKKACVKRALENAKSHCLVLRAINGISCFVFSGKPLTTKALQPLHASRFRTTRKKVIECFTKDWDTYNLI